MLWKWRKGIYGLYRDNGQENGNYFIGLRFQMVGFTYYLRLTYLSFLGDLFLCTHGNLSRTQESQETPVESFEP